MADGRSVWKVSAVIEATEDESQAAADAIATALCPGPEHSGYCEVPWTTMIVRFDELEPEEQASWQEAFDEARSAARKAGESET